MLERTAGCLEPGNLRHLIPGSKKPFKSQRMLHSTFWIHGAGELDLPPLWAMLTGEYGVARDVETKEKKSSGTNTITSGFLLDFLYPAGTFLRQFSGWSLAQQGSSHAKYRSTRFGHRLFSSGITNRNISDSESPSVEESAVSRAGSENIENTDEIGGPDMSREELEGPAVQELRRLINADPKIDQEEVWRQFSNLPAGQKDFVVSQVFYYLSFSKRRIDAERVISLLESIRPEDRKDAMWRYGVKAFLAMDNLAEAVTLQRMAVKYKVESCTWRLLAAQLRTRDWEAARDTYTAHQTEISGQQNGEHKSLMNDPVILKATTRMPEFAVIALELAKQAVDYRTWNPETGSFREIKDFAVLIVRHALIPPAGVGNFQKDTFRALLNILQLWDADPPELYKKLIFILHQRRSFTLLASTYREYRQKHPDKVARSVIRKMLEVFCNSHDVQGIQEVLDDSFACLGGPEKATYIKCMIEFSWQGDAKSVERLFEQYTDRFCRVDNQIRLETANEFAPLLNAYARRGALPRVISIFDEITTKYKLKPSLMCWNILINAYGKVQDIDGAFERFEQLSASGHKPDHWTIGTLMGICVARGDADRTMEVFQISTSMNIPVSTAMIGCLVLAKIQDEELDQAQELCEKARGMKLEYSPRDRNALTRMWNQLLTAYSLRRDINGANRILQRMKELRINYDIYTYSALMLSLAMVKQANSAWLLLTDAMPKAGLLPNSFHYAVVMGGFLHTGEIDMLFKTYDRMLSRNIEPNGSTSILALRASAALDQRKLEASKSSDESMDQTRSELAEEYFDEVVRTLDPYKWITATPRTGMSRDPVDIAYHTAVFRFMIFVYGSNRMMDRVQQLYAEYNESLPEKLQDQTPPIRMLEALMKANLEDENYIGVEQCWALAFDSAKKSGSRIRPGSGPYRVMPYQRFSLSASLMLYMHAMARQDKLDELRLVVAQVEDAGFVLDTKNWNVYIQHLVRGRYIRQAFHYCETKLMANWTGWKTLRWKDHDLPNHIPWETRLKGRTKGYNYPYYFTLLGLARAWLDANEMSAENKQLRGIIMDLKDQCPRLVAVLEIMPRTLDPTEMEVMTGDEW